VLVNPLHAALPVVPQQPSPYFPSSRRFRNPLYLRVEDVAGFDALPDAPALAAAGRALDDASRIARDNVHRLKMDALARLWARFAGDPEFDRWRREQGEALRNYGV